MPKVTKEHVEGRRMQILTATYRCLGRKGFRRTTLKDICREAGLSMGAVYGYYRSKEDIVVALAEAYRQRNLALGAPPPASGDPVDWLCEIVRRVATSPDVVDSMRIDVRLWAEALDTPLLKEQVLLSYRAQVEATERLVREGQRERGIPDTVNPRAAACVVSSIVLGFGLQKLWDEGLDTDSYLEAATAVLRSSLARRDVDSP